MNGGTGAKSDASKLIVLTYVSSPPPTFLMNIIANGQTKNEEITPTSLLSLSGLISSIIAELLWII